MIPRPNPEAVEYLEADLDLECSVLPEEWQSSPRNGVQSVSYRGKAEARFTVRPMFELIKD